ncbi:MULTISPECIES: hypothetical protein [Streptomyces]|uniref:Uncharacterized protein n=2 Tax=Streptomyces TaxID=1883 RepID=A0ABV9IM00_9ACTN
MSDNRFKARQIIYDGSALGRERLRVVRYTAHGLIEVKDSAGRKGWINPDDARAWSA